MKKFIFILAVLFFGQASFAQENTNLELINASDIKFCEKILAGLDGIMYQTFKTQNSVGYVVIHGGANPIDNVFLKTFVVNYRRYRKFDEKRLLILTAKDDANPRIEFWLSKNGEKPSVIEQNFDYVLPNQNERILFVEDFVSLVNFDGELNYVGDWECPACCLTSFDIYKLGDFLDANPEMNAEITVYNNRKGKAQDLINLIIKDAVKQAGIPRARFKIYYGGKYNGYASAEGSNVKVWLVPKSKK